MAEKEMNNVIYNKLLIGHYHPENNCNVEEGAVLTVIPVNFLIMVSC